MILQSLSEYLTFRFSFMWLIVIVVLLILALLFLRNYIARDSVVKMNLGYFAFIISYAITRILFFIGDYFGEYQNLENVIEFTISMKAAYIVSSIGMLVMLFIFEKDIIPTRFILSIVDLVCIILFILLPYDFMKPVMYVFQALVVVEILSIYIYLAVKGTGALRKKAIYTIISILVLFTGVLLDMRIVSDLNIEITWIVAPILVITGSTLFFIFQSYRKKK